MLSFLHLLLNMKTIEFQSTVSNGIIRMPERYRHKRFANARVIVLTNSSRLTRKKEAHFTDFGLEMPVDYKFNREEAARLSLERWYKEVDVNKFKSFNTISATVYEHHEEILNFFTNRSTNASAKSFNAKIKTFKAFLRGITDMKFFLFRVAKI